MDQNCICYLGQLLPPSQYALQDLIYQSPYLFVTVYFYLSFYRIICQPTIQKWIILVLQKMDRTVFVFVQLMPNAFVKPF